MDEVDNSVQGDAAGGKWHATLQPGTASLTATAGRAPIKYHGVRAGEGAR
ncbi:DUF6380 family protein [Streptomyces sp. NPDC001668]